MVPLEVVVDHTSDLLFSDVEASSMFFLKRTQQKWHEGTGKRLEFPPPSKKLRAPRRRPATLWGSQPCEVEKAVDSIGCELLSASMRK